MINFGISRDSIVGPRASLPGDVGGLEVLSELATKFRRVASDDRRVASCLSKRTARLGANDRSSCRSSDMVSMYSLDS